MIVFSNYFKIVKKHLGLIIMFAAISIVISIANTSYSDTTDYVSVTPTISIINYDDSLLTDHFIEYIKSETKIVELNDNEKTIQDALYNNDVDAVLIIPQNFGYDLQAGEMPEIKIKKSTQSASEYIEILVNRYFNIAEVYYASGMSETQIISKLENDLSNQVTVKILNEKKENLDKLALYYQKGDSISLNDIKKIVASNINDNAFKFVDAVLGKDMQQTFRLLEDFMRVKLDVLQLINLLARELRLIYYYKIYEKKKYTLINIAKELKLQDWQVKKIMKEASLYHEDDVSDYLVKLSKLDVSIKSGQVDKNNAFYAFLLEFFEY